MVAVDQGHLTKLLSGCSVAVEIPLGQKCIAVERRCTEGGGPLPTRLDSPALLRSSLPRHHRGTPGGPLTGRLPHRAETEDVPCQPGGDGHAGVDDGSELARYLVTPCMPGEIESEHALYVVDPGTGETGRQRDSRRSPGERGQAVDVLRSEAGIGDRGHARLSGELERVPVEPAADVGPPDPAHHGLILEVPVRPHVKTASSTTRKTGR